MGMTKNFMIWWLIAVIGFIAVGVGAYIDGLDYLLAVDATKISIAIIAIMLLTTLHVGYKIFQGSKDFDTAWFIAESCMSLGMIGTMLGFMMMLRDSLGDINPQDVSAMQNLIGNMAYGMSTALVTTLAGLVASLFIKIQIVTQEHLDG